MSTHETITKGVKLTKQNAGTGIKILTPNKILTIITVLLSQIKAENNSCKPKNEIKLILYVLRQHNKVTKTLYNNLIK